jgi:hypothetical protein
MRPKCPLAAHFSPNAIAIVVLVVCSFADKSAEAQSSQPFPPAQSQRPDQTKPLEDRSVRARRSSAAGAHRRRNEQEGKVASAFLRGLQFQE